MDQIDPNTGQPVSMNLIKVTSVLLSDFNSNANAYLKDVNGKYKYDGIYFGSEDSNGGWTPGVNDLTAASQPVVAAFANTGRSVLLGHDTVAQVHVSHEYFNRFAPKLGLKFYGDLQTGGGTTSGGLMDWRGSNQVAFTNRGMLTQYPYVLDSTAKYQISPCHTLGQYYMYNDGGVRWMEFSGGTPVVSDITHYAYDSNGQVIGDDNWYLVTKNNYAMIQTGHSNGQCTPDEAKIIANLVYYTSTLNTTTEANDFTAKDITAPNEPTSSRVSEDQNGAKIKIDASDIGTNYYYRVQANTTSGMKYSDTVKVPITSGMKGYVYSIDDNPSGTVTATKDPVTGDVNNINLTTTSDTDSSNTINLTRSAHAGKYLHIVSVDKANNVSAVKTISLAEYLWWNVDSSDVLTIYPHELNSSADSNPFPNPNNPYYRDWPWYPYRDHITKAVLKPGVTARGGLSVLFQWQPLLTTIEGLERLDTSEVTNMYGMFWECKSLTNLNVTNFDTSSVTNMNSMFSGCRSLTDIDVTHFNTSNVYSMQGMFENCSSLTSLDITNFDTSKVEYMFGVFSGCSSLTSLDLTHFNTSSAKYMGSLFSDCTSLRSLDLTGFDTSKAEEMYYMFDGCEQLTDVDVTSFDTSSVTNMMYMFRGCKSLTSLDLSSFDLTNVTNTSDGYGRINHGYHEMLKDTDKLWKLTLGPNTKFPDVTVDGLEVSVKLKDPTPGKPINDLAKPVPPNSQYFATDAQWREASTDDFLHEPDGEAKTADEIMSESATANRKRTYVWDQRGRVLLEAPTAIDFGTHRGSVRSHNYKSEDHKFKVTDNRNSRKNKKWRIEAAMTKPLTKGTKRITGNPLHHKNGSGVETNLTPVAVQLAEKVIPGVIYEDTWEEPWNMLFKTTANEIPEAGSYSGEVTYTLLDSTP
ncbi:BspA family leucine-rich repeat surface protein [Xylocopilactobacillus apicola]|uniref:BspA family leucine-rich repeat surface protein n=1 Tax=Xylocopilactobacillus apicola TaxID=2932184 RepID=A0AAU9D924_9LACO|nr:BspA family leucine-rich repeat surface protein [Xylocopilactobacillus apicola]BDR57970.1 hypothetical protein XA3_04110 [Xylocopilactobacillus apicola]